MEQKIKKLYICMGIMLVMVFGCISVSAATLMKSKDVIYDNSKSGIESTNVQEAVDELYSAATDYSDHERRLQALETNSFLNAHPIGSIYLTISEEENTVTKMHNLYGGTWERYSEGRTLVGVGTGTDSNGTVKVFNKNESAGEYSHKLTISEMPSHNHIGLYDCLDNMFNVSNGSSYYGIRFQNYDTVNIDGGPYFTGKTGGSDYHNNIQPYTTVYMYKRVN